MDRILRPKDVSQAIGFSRTTLWRRVRDGSFPRPLRIGGEKSHLVGWRQSAVEEWLDSRPSA